MKFKKLMLVSALSLGLIGTSLPVGSVSAQILGGWSEDQGYWNVEQSTLETTNETILKNSNDIMPLSFPVVAHTGSVSFTKRGSMVYERVTGNTTWPTIYHYTRARYEDSITGTISSDSGRSWGTGYTSATSGWNTGDFATAKTYYGL